MQKGEWAEWAVPGAEFVCKVVPRAKRVAIVREARLGHGWVIKISVTSAPEDGRATAAVAMALAQALGVVKTRLTLVRGAISREKVFRLD
ncbi:DUF167 domain-containing protein [Cypionkella sp.]|uniref:DUF167 domain-containing protein n=1 Tax=Cypionkella sp. TaxID=2811411 RepID=UPI00263A3269|nr:DUF167 domain-containing protein [Cypionkella sp.]MDB5664582.1 hypothetical protein [Cypionkella sp.]